jgi:hypothetical protein
MAREIDIKVKVFEAPMYNPRDPDGSKPWLMNPPPMSTFHGRWGDDVVKRKIVEALKEKGLSIRSANWAGANRDEFLVYVPTVEALDKARQPAPLPPPKRPRRSAVARRHRASQKGRRG